MSGPESESSNDHYTSAAEVLADMTGRPKEEFIPDAEIPEFDPEKLEEIDE